MAQVSTAISSKTVARSSAPLAAARAICVPAITSIALISSLLLPTGCRA